MKHNFYVATSIPYVNDKPHLGHALEFTYADVLARYYRALGCQVTFSVGTDEHGGKVNEKAVSLKLKPQDFVDQISAKFKQALTGLEISNTHFIRTTDSNHCQKAQLIWQKLQDYIYKDTYEGSYCQGCEAYQTATVVEATKGICPDHNQAYKLLREENYFFKLSAFTKELKEKIENGQLKIIPEAAKLETLGLLEQGLADISISRSVDNLKWGIAVPNDSTQVMYVWFEALMNYITVLDYPNGQDFKTYWPADVQIVGRDILRFHAIIWPAMLLGLKLPLYRQLYVHGLITVEGRKMSKTLGNSIDPLELIDKYGLDAFRYFFLRHLPAYDNGDYSLQRFIDAYNNELVDQLGNLVHRLQTLIWQKLQGRLPLEAEAAFKEADFLTTYHQALKDCRFDYALNLIFAQIKALNKNLEMTQPWMIDDLKQVEKILDQTSVNLKLISQLLEPFLPHLSQKITEIFATNLIKEVDRPLLEKINSN